jgi:hypothetical protein
LMTVHSRVGGLKCVKKAFVVILIFYFKSFLKNNLNLFLF